MRAIKFRAWDKVRKELIEVSHIIFFPLTEKGDWAQILPLFAPTKEWLLVPSEADLMQYTGLKDKKRTKEFPEGQEIYKGNMINVLGGKRGPIVFECGCFGYRDLTGFFIALGVRQGKYSGKMSDIEIIGNIHENPELLEKAK